MLSILSLSRNEKKSSFECGFNILSNNRVSFSNQFFIIAMLFLIFDIEIALILPYPLVREYNYMSKLIIFIFILVLLVGLLYEWNQMVLSWVK